MLDLKTYHVEIELIEDLLGTVPLSRAVYANFIASKGREMLEKQARKGIPAASGRTVSQHEPVADPLEGNSSAALDGEAPVSAATLVQEEVETIEEVEERGWTGFHQDEEGPFLFDYSIKGFLSEAARTLKESNTVKQLQDKFKRYVFVRPRRVRLPKPGRIEDFAGKPLLVMMPNGSIVCERPLRAMTAQGPRVTVTRSDVVLAGSKIVFDLAVLKGGGVTKPILHDVLSYGELIGLGQWRSSGAGRFSLLNLESE